MTFPPPNLNLPPPIFLAQGRYKYYPILLGQGAHSKVFSGEETETHQLVAVKQIDPQEFPVDHLERELNNMVNSDHPNIIKIIDAFYQDGYPYIILQLCQGSTVLYRIRSEGFFTEQHAARITKSILSAVQYLHSRSIIHRDIKAGNVFFLTNDPDSKVLLGDFGFSKLITPTDKAISFAGTPEYMAPEVLRIAIPIFFEEIWSDYDQNSQPSYDHKCDIWSIGILAFHMITGRIPFDVQKPPQAAEAMIKQKYSFPNRISQSCRDFINRCLRPNPSQRPEASELLQHEWIQSNVPDDE